MLYRIWKNIQKMRKPKEWQPGSSPIAPTAPRIMSTVHVNPSKDFNDWAQSLHEERMRVFNIKPKND